MVRRENHYLCPMDRLFFLLMMSGILFSFQQPVHEVPPKRAYEVKIDTLSLDNSEELIATDQARRYWKVLMKYGEYDSVRVYLDDTLISGFRCRHYRVYREITGYHSNGTLAYRDHLMSSYASWCRTNTYYGLFKGVRHGKSEGFFPDGKKAHLTYYRYGNNDTFEQIWDRSGKLYSQKHLDTQLYFHEKGYLQTKSIWMTVNDERFLADYTYWPNGKLRYERYYLDYLKKRPCRVWSEYTNKGVLVKRFEQPSEAPAPEEVDKPFGVYETSSYEDCDLKKALQDRLRKLLKEQVINGMGTYVLKFKKSNNRYEFVSLEGADDPRLVSGIKVFLTGMDCMQEHLIRMGDAVYFYTLKFQLSE
jgi:hypothetical protein